MTASRGKRLTNSVGPAELSTHPRTAVKQLKLKVTLFRPGLWEVLMNRMIPSDGEE